MRSFAVSLATALLLLATAGSADALSQDSACCACVAENDDATTSGYREAPALFCAEFPSIGEAEAACDELSGQLLCLAQMVATSGLNGNECVAELSQMFACPSAARAPAAGGAALLALAAALGLGGTVALRRRRR